MSITRLETSWLGIDQDTKKLFFWDGVSYRPLEEAAGYATTGDVAGLATLIAGRHGRLKSMWTFIENTTYEPASDVYLGLAYGWGAGGGGGGAGGGANKGAAGAGGGGGGFGWKLIDMSAVNSVIVTIGAPGAGGSTAGGDGGDGGSTSFGAYLSATGGIGGTGQEGGDFAQIVQGGSGGTASGGDFNVTGTAGQPGIRLDYRNGIAGHGAPAALLGGGGNGFAGNTKGQNGYARGDGGGGGVVADSATGRAGGDGGSGMIWLWEFA
jgi:hypothetical protein